MPTILYRYWNVFVVTASGSLLMYAVSAFPITLYLHGRTWRKNNAMMAGNGSQHVIVARNDLGFDLADLGTRAQTQTSTKVIKFLLGILWMVLLITSTGIK